MCVHILVCGLSSTRTSPKTTHSEVRQELSSHSGPACEGVTIPALAKETLSGLYPQEAKIRMLLQLHPVLLLDLTGSPDFMLSANLHILCASFCSHFSSLLPSHLPRMFQSLGFHFSSSFLMQCFFLPPLFLFPSFTPPPSSSPTPIKFLLALPYSLFYLIPLSFP